MEEMKTDKEKTSGQQPKSQTGADKEKTTGQQPPDSGEIKTSKEKEKGLQADSEKTETATEKSTDQQDDSEKTQAAEGKATNHEPDAEKMKADNEKTTGQQPKSQTGADKEKTTTGNHKPDAEKMKADEEKMVDQQVDSEEMKAEEKTVNSEETKAEEKSADSKERTTGEKTVDSKETKADEEKTKGQQADSEKMETDEEMTAGQQTNSEEKKAGEEKTAGKQDEEMKANRSKPFSTENVSNEKATNLEKAITKEEPVQKDTTASSETVDNDDVILTKVVPGPSLQPEDTTADSKQENEDTKNAEKAASQPETAGPKSMEKENTTDSEQQDQSQSSEMIDLTLEDNDVEALSDNAPHKATDREHEHEAKSGCDQTGETGQADTGSHCPSSLRENHAGLTEKGNTIPAEEEGSKKMKRLSQSPKAAVEKEETDPCPMESELDPKPAEERVSPTAKLSGGKRKHPDSDQNSSEEQGNDKKRKRADGDENSGDEPMKEEEDIGHEKMDGGETEHPVEHILDEPGVSRQEPQRREPTEDEAGGARADVENREVDDDDDDDDDDIALDKRLEALEECASKGREMNMLSLKLLKEVKKYRARLVAEIRRLSAREGQNREEEKNR